MVANRSICDIYSALSQSGIEPNEELASEIDGAAISIAISPRVNDPHYEFVEFLEDLFDAGVPDDLIVYCVDLVIAAQQECKKTGEIKPAFLGKPNFHQLGDAWAAGFIDRAARFRLDWDELLFDPDNYSVLYPLLVWIKDQKDKSVIELTTEMLRKEQFVSSFRLGRSLGILCQMLRSSTSSGERS